MNKQIKARCFVCIDENGNYQIVGTSKPTPENKLIVLVENGIRGDARITTKTFHIDFNIPIPEHEKDI